MINYRYILYTVYFTMYIVSKLDSQNIVTSPHCLTIPFNNSVFGWRISVCHTVCMGSYTQSWVRDNIAATTQPCFPAKKLLIILYVALSMYIHTLWLHREAFTFFVLCHVSEAPLCCHVVACRCCEAKKLVACPTLLISMGLLLALLLFHNMTMGERLYCCRPRLYRTLSQVKQLHV